MLKINEVYNMDCANGIKLLDDKSIDLLLWFQKINWV